MATMAIKIKVELKKQEWSHIKYSVPLVENGLRHLVPKTQLVWLSIKLIKMQCSEIFSFVIVANYWWLHCKRRKISTDLSTTVHVIGKTEPMLPKLLGLLLAVSAKPSTHSRRSGPARGHAFYHPPIPCSAASSLDAGAPLLSTTAPSRGCTYGHNRSWQSSL